MESGDQYARALIRGPVRFHEQGFSCQSCSPSPPPKKKLKWEGLPEPTKKDKVVKEFEKIFC